MTKLDKVFDKVKTLLEDFDVDILAVGKRGLVLKVPYEDKVFSTWEDLIYNAIEHDKYRDEKES